MATEKKGTPPTPTRVPDPLIDEVRAIRRELSESAGNDVDRLCAQLEQIEREQAHRVVRQVPHRGLAPPR